MYHEILQLQGAQITFMWFYSEHETLVSKSRNQMQERAGQKMFRKQSFPYGIGMSGMNEWQTSEADLRGMLITFIIPTPHRSQMSPWQSDPGATDKGFIWLGNDSF